MLTGPEDLPDYHPAWHGRLAAHGDMNSLLDTAASLQAFHPLVLPVFVWARTVALPLLRGPLSCRTVLALLDVDCPSNLLPLEILVVVSACWYIIRVSEDLHFLKCSSAPAPEFARDPASCSTVPLVHRLGLWFGGCGVPALLKGKSCPISILIISEGAVRRACTALTCEPPVVPSPEVVEELRSLHPGPAAAHQGAMDELRDVGPGAVPVIDPDMVRKALSSFAPISGAGPSGLRPSQLQEALRHSSGDQTLRLVSEVIQLMLRGEIPEDIRPWMCGASLMAPRKPNGSLRPVAVGESLRRLCSKVAVELMGSSVRSILEPTQVGVQTKAGCEAVIHSTRQWTKTFCHDPDGVLVLVRSVQRFQLCFTRSRALGCTQALSVDDSVGRHMLPSRLQSSGRQLSYS